MLPRAIALTCLVLLGAALPGGCPRENYADLAPTDLAAVNRIINGDLEGNDRREALAELGLSPLMINAVLRSEGLLNQFGGTRRTAYEKVAGDRLLDLTPDEVQIYANSVNQIDTDIAYTLTDSQAQDIVTFFNDYGIRTRAALESFLDTPGSEVPDTIPDGALRDLFVDFDPALLLPILP